MEKVVLIRRLAMFIEDWLYRGMHWVIFEPNDDPLWASRPLSSPL